MNKFVDVPREAFIEKMEAAGFHLSLTDNAGEMVFIRRNHYNQDLMVKIYSSIPNQASHARDCGEDAVRVLAVYDPPKGSGRSFRRISETYKVLRVNSVDGVLERTLQRAREAYILTNRACAVIGPAVEVVA